MQAFRMFTVRAAVMLAVVLVVQLATTSAVVEAALPREGCICNEIYQPVCGANGETYGNTCQAKCAGVRVLYNGKCGSQTIDPNPITPNPSNPTNFPTLPLPKPSQWPQAVSIPSFGSNIFGGGRKLLSGGARHLL